LITFGLIAFYVVSILLHSFEIKHLAHEFREENNQECIIKKTKEREDDMKKQQVSKALKRIYV